MRSKNSNYIKGIVLFIILFIILESIVISQQTKFEEQEHLLILEKLIDYRSDIDLLFSKYVYLTQGFTLNIENELEEEEIIYKDLESIFSISDSFINNIGIIKDTTLIYNYPIEGNQGSIGVDLSKIESQRKNILLVKDHGIDMIQGPIELVQGGKGFILRSPIYQNKEYWGQIGIVFKEIELEKYLAMFGQNYDINIHIINNKSNQSLISNFNIDKQDVVEITYNNYYLDWTLLAIPQEGWTSSNSTFIIGTTVALSLTFIITFFYIKLLLAINQLSYHATHDRLTRVYNRRFLDERLDSVIYEYSNNQCQFGIINIDVNDFKIINDKYGHQIGDLVLIAIARNLELVCNSNCQLFRNGGDEFIIIVFDIACKTDIFSICDNIKNHFDNNEILNSKKIQVSLSLGTAIFPTDGLSSDELLKVADVNMYAEKITYHNLKHQLY